MALWRKISKDFYAYGWDYNFVVHTRDNRWLAVFKSMSIWSYPTLHEAKEAVERLIKNVPPNKEK